jgi:hypothetical protein
MSISSHLKDPVHYGKELALWQHRGVSGEGGRIAVSLSDCVDSFWRVERVIVD